ncbi:MAG: ATP-binding cassette domain-containing protein [Candidatus Marsarchaeota archaeon]|nr:ATP-binding cassette domain-containing protein [Candidatus Marsarchaeota archaeon]
MKQEPYIEYGKTLAREILMPTISISSLTKRFGKLTAVDGVSLDIERGEIFGLLGPNGAGKTTLLSMLAVLMEPTSGDAHVAGWDIRTQALAVRKSIGMVFQGGSLDNLLTARENLELHARLFAVPKELRARRIEEALALVELTERADERAGNYSGGMKRRLEIARALLHHPQVLFLDEPTVGLDPQTREHIWAYIKKLAQAESMTIILTTHYMEEADLLCDRIALIDRGKIVQLDTPEGLKRQMGGDKVKLVRAKACSRQQLARMRKLPFVKSVAQEDGHLALVVLNAPKHLQRILAEVGEVEEVHVLPASLNDVFLQYTGHAIRNEAAEDDAQAHWAAHR